MRYFSNTIQDSQEGLSASYGTLKLRTPFMHYIFFYNKCAYLSGLPRRKGGGGTDIALLVSVTELRRAGRVIRVLPDGNCLFRGIATSFYNDTNRHADVRKQVTAFLLEKGRDYCFRKGIYDPDWTMQLTAKYNTFAAYVKYIGTPGTYGDTACLRVFQELHPLFRFVVWEAINASVRFTDRFDSMVRCAVHQREDILQAAMRDTVPLGKVAHFWYHGSHFDLLDRVTAKDIKPRTYFLDEQRAHHHTNACRPADAGDYMLYLYILMWISIYICHHNCRQ